MSTTPLTSPTERHLILTDEDFKVVDASLRDDESAEVVAFKGHYLAIFVSCFIGYAFFVLWNALLNAGDYFYFVFPAYHPDRVIPVVYLLLLLVISAIFIFSTFGRQHNQLRILIGFWAFFIVSSCIIIVTVNPLNLGASSSFTAICIQVAFAGVGEGICGPALFGEFSFMHPSYLQAFNAGTAASGFATSLLRLLTKYISGDSPKGLRNGALIFFGLAGSAHLIGIVLYTAVLPRLEGVQIYRLNAAAQNGTFGENSRIHHLDKDPEASPESAPSTPPMLPLTTKEIIYQNRDYILDLIILYSTTFSIIPGFLYENTGTHDIGTWYPLVLMAVFNFGDFISRINPVEVLFIKSRRVLRVCCCGLVLIFIPAFYVTAKYGGLGYMVFLCVSLGATTGYLTICIFEASLVGYKSMEQSVLAGLLYLAMTIGGVFGAAGNWFWLLS